MGVNVKKDMTKSALFIRLEQLRQLSEAEAIQPVYKDAVIDTLLDYIRDREIREKVEAIVL